MIVLGLNTAFAAVTVHLDSFGGPWCVPEDEDVLSTLRYGDGGRSRDFIFHQNS